MMLALSLFNLDTFSPTHNIIALGGTTHKIKWHSKRVIKVSTDLQLVGEGWVVGNAFTLGQQHTAEAAMKNL